MKKEPSLKDVAKKAGVAIGTASRVLNNNSTVTSEMRERVLKAMEELGYTPNGIARSLKTKQTFTIGVMIPDIHNPFYTKLVSGIENVAKKHSYNIILCNTDLNRDAEIKTLNMFMEKKVDGIIFTSNTVDEELAAEFQKCNIPIVLAATSYDKQDFYSVIIDNEQAAYEVVDYLCSLGHKKIVMLAGEKNDPNAGIPRIDGYKRALKKNNIEFNESLVYEGDYKYKCGYDNMIKIIDKGEMPTAIFAASDATAIGAAKALLERRYRIPEDISIVGFDGIEVTEYFHPAITTVEQPRFNIGVESMKLLIKLINKEEVEKKHIILNYELLLRESCISLI